MTNSSGMSLEFTQLCNYLAVRSTIKDEHETIRNLVIQAMAILPTEPMQGPPQLEQAIEVLFGVRIDERRLQIAIDHLTASQTISRQPTGNLVLAQELPSQIRQRIDDANELQARVKQKWLSDCHECHPQVNPDMLWAALQEYLARAFRQHGMQTISLLDSSLSALGAQEGLRTILTTIISKTRPTNQAQAVEECLSGFLADVGFDADRSRFIVQLADGAFAHFALNAPPEVARTLKQNLSELTLFLDTNFLFGVLDLHSNPFVEASQELVRAINDNGLPFALRYHPNTEQEMRNTLESIAQHLRGRKWPQAISRAAIRSKTITGLELKYHEANANMPIDPDVFFGPCRHVDVLLRDKNILPLDGNRDTDSGSGSWLSSYQQHIHYRRLDKPQASMAHDAKLLDSVHQRRTNNNSSLEAGALCITCDYALYRFDWEESGRQRIQPVMVLPNMFLQILRPFVPPSWDFDKMFAETFAIPEFRTAGSGSSQAASRLLALLATYKDFPEATAVRMLANDALLDELHKVQDPVKFEEQVEAAIVNENTELIEEKAELERKLAEERIAAEEERRQQLAERQSGAALQQQEAQRAEVSERELSKLQGKLLESEMEATSANDKAKETAKSLHRLVSGIRIAGFIVASGVWIAVVLLLPGWLGWQWLITHQNRYAMQAVTVVLGMLGIAGAFFSERRKRLWFGSAGVLALVVVLLSLLGGPRE